LQNDEVTLKASALAVFLCCIFGANAVAIKFSLTGLGAFTAAGIRFAIAAVVILTWAWYRKISLGLTGKQLRQMLLLSAIFIVQFTCFYHGLDKTTASHGVLISNLLPFGVLILAHCFIPGERVSFKKGVGIIFGFAGVFLLFFDSQDIAASLKSGDVIVLAAVICWSTNVVFIKRINQNYHPVQITFYPMIFSTPIFLLCGFLWDDQMIRMMNATVIKAVLYQSVIAASFGFITWNTLLKRFGASSLHSFIFIMPMAGVLASVLLLGESVTSFLAASVAFIVTGIIIVNFKIRKRPV